LELELIQTLQGHKGPVNHIAWDPYGLTLGSASEDNLVILWDPLSGKPCQVIDQHQAGVNCLSWSFSKDYLASGDRNSVINIRDYLDNTSWELGRQAGPVTKINWLPGSSILASYSLDNTIRVWDIQSRSAINKLDFHEPVCDFTWHTEGSLLVSFKDKAVLYTIGKYSNSPTSYPIQSQELISGNFRMPNGILVPNPASRHIDFYDLEMKAKVNTIISRESNIQSLHVSPNNPLIVSVSSSGSHTLWRTNTLEKKKLDISGDQMPSHPFDFHPKWPVFASLADKGKSIQIWKVNYQ